MNLRLWTTMSTGIATVCLVTAPAIAQTRRININSTPAGATVRLDGPTVAPLGVTPLRNRAVRPGPHTLFFELAGYVTGQLNINASRNGETFTGTLVQAGSISVSADVDSASVSVDGQAQGNTPRRIDNLAPGAHVVEVRTQGLPPVTQTVTVVSGSVATVNATLRPAVGTVRVVVSNPDGPVPADTAVTLDGAPLTGTPPSSNQVQPGTHIVQVTAAGFRTVRREVTVTANQTQALAVDLERAAAQTGSVRVTVAVQGAQVYLDGTAMTGTPALAEGVQPGQHTVRIQAPGRATITREVTVVAGQPINIDIAEMSTAGGRISVRSSVPGAEVLLDGSSVGAAPYENANASPGQHIVLVRAPGYQDMRRDCTVDASNACEVVAELQRVQATGGIHVESNVASARVRINDETELRAPGDITGLPVGQVRVTISADNYESHTETVNVVENNVAPLRVTLRRTGPTGRDVARRRTAISTWGAAPLVRGDAAFDLLGSYGGMPLEFRATLGFMPGGRVFAVDGGLAIRTKINWWEFELRSRIGVRLIENLAIGAEGRFYGAIGTNNSNGVGGTLQLNLSGLFSLSSDEEVAGESDVDRANRFGSFATTLSFGVEWNNDSPSDQNVPTYTPSVAPTDGLGEAAVSLCENRVGRSSMTGCTISTTARSYLQLVIEFGLGRHINVFGGLTYYLPQPDEATYEAPGSNGARRAILADFWGGPTRAVVRGGLTYKF